MSALRIYEESGGVPRAEYTDFASIASALERIGVRFERWEAAHALEPDAAQETVIAAYRSSVDRLMDDYGFQSVDVVSLTPDHPKRQALRDQFLQEHIHDDFEVRFFVDGSGLFYIRAGGKVYATLCERGDLISVPANTTHWFDMGERPRFKCIRLFTTTDGWVAKFTGDPIADRFPRMGE